MSQDEIVWTIVDRGDGALVGLCGLDKISWRQVSRWSAELASRGCVLAPVFVKVVDDIAVVVVSARVEWFIARAAETT